MSLKLYDRSVSIDPIHMSMKHVCNRSWCLLGVSLQLQIDPSGTEDANIYGD